MLECVIFIIFVWLFFKAIKLAVSLTWGVAKVVGSILAVIALPLLVVGLIFVGGLFLLLPLLVVGLAFAILKKCV